jgi:hypothetical protein
MLQHEWENHDPLSSLQGRGRAPSWRSRRCCLPTGVGSEITSTMALPVLGGLLIADEVVDIFLPVRFYWVRRARWLKLQEKILSPANQARPTSGEIEAVPALAQD